MAGYTLERRSRSKLFASFLLTVAVSFGAAPKTATNKVSAVRFWSLGESTRVAVDVSAGFKFKFERLTNPDRLFFDIEGAKPDMVAKGLLHTIPVGDAILKQIRIAETQPGVTRIVLDLEQRAEFTASQLTSPDRLMIELRGRDKPAPSIVGKVKEMAPPIPVPREVTHPIDATASGRSTDTKVAEARVNETRVTDARPVEKYPVEPRRDPPPPVVAASKPEPRKFEPPPHTEDAGGFRTSAAAPELLPPPPVSAKTSRLSGSSLSSMRGSLPPPPIATAPELKSETAFSSTPSSTSSTSAASAKSAGVAAEPAKRNANGDRSMARVLGLKLGRVVIDPGHGGRDVGTRGPSGLFEKEVVLDVARRLGALIEERLSSEVIYTRSDDTFIQLEERPRIANEHKADLFLSIHANSSPIKTAAGVEMYYLNFTTSRAALDVAARENAGSASSLHDLKDLLEKIALKDKIDESREFATRLQNSLSSLETKGNTAAKNRGLKQAPFIVLIGANMPSVLAEIGFLTNTGDEALLRKPEHRQKIAEALYKGIANYAETLSHFQVAQKHE